MQKMCLFRLPIMLMGLLLLAVFSCGGVDREVVRVTEVVKDPYQGLKQGDVAKLEQYKKAISAADRGSEISTIVEKTANYTVAQYLQKFADNRDMDQDYKLGAYDVISITVYQEPDLTVPSLRVSADGTISFPLIGRIRVADLTTFEVEKLIARRLAEEEYLLQANISVLVTSYESRKYSALGGVKNPGSYPVQGRERLLDGISKAGGIDTADQGEKHEAMVIRTLNPGQPNESRIVINIDLQGLLKGTDQISNIYLADRDVIYIPKANYFYIIGEVKNPGAFAFTKKDISIVEALSMAGGFTPIADRNKTRIVRVETGVEKIYDVKVDAITQAGRMIQAVPIKPNDLIVVPVSFF